jgi:small subunit ribosomal protein S7
VGDTGSNAKTGNQARSAGANAAFSVSDSSASARQRTSQSQAREADRAQDLASSAISSTSSSTTSPGSSSAVRLPSESVGASSLPSAATKPGYDVDSLPKPMNALFSTIIGLLQKEGKKAKAMRQLSDVLQHLTAAANGSPLPILTAAVERASPLVRMRSRKQGGKNIQVPLPLSERQATRRGITAILEASKKRSDAELSVRLAKEILAVVEGTSNTLQRKEEAHKIALINRANAAVRI